MKTESIKFKAKRLDNGEWIEGEISHFENTIWIVPIHHKPFHSGCAEVDPDTICMFTGLKDCRGKELFENDLIHFIGHKPIGKLIWSEENYAFMVASENEALYWLSDVQEIGKIEIVGNKFDRKEGEK